MEKIERPQRAMDEINEIEDNECWALTEMINRAEIYVVSLDHTISMLEAFETAAMR